MTNHIRHPPVVERTARFIEGNTNAFTFVETPDGDEIQPTRALL